MYNDIRVATQGDVTTVTMARGERRNAIDKRMAAEIAHAFRAFDASTSKVAVLWGEGGTFCAGADLKAIGTDRTNRIEPDGDGPLGVSRLKLSKPTIAAVTGYAVAGGLELAIWCDLRVVEESASFGVFSRRWGRPLMDGGTVRLPRLIGQSRAMDMILTGRQVGAKEAELFGLANRVVPDGKALEVAQELGAYISQFPSASMRGDRESLVSQWSVPEQVAMEREFSIGMISRETDGIAGVAAFSHGAGRHGRFHEC